MTEGQEIKMAVELNRLYKEIYADYGLIGTVTAGRMTIAGTAAQRGKQTILRWKP